MALDLSEDYLLIDDPLTVTLYRKSSATGHATGVPVTYAQRNAQDVHYLKDGVLIRERKTFYHLWKARLTAAGLTQPPKPGDVIEDSGVRNVIESVEHMDRDANGTQRYRCPVMRE
jgi:hypothetical protein